MKRSFQPQELLGTSQQREMQRVTQPPNHDGMDVTQLPPVHEAHLTAEQVEALFSDLGQHAGDIQIMSRRTTPADSDHTSRLPELSALLLSGKIAKAQIRYTWRGARWIDTIECNANDFRLVRIRHSHQ
jgi:hypothetical protein